jgi:electron transport complex protein RnfC
VAKGLFRGGVHPPARKEATRERPIERIALPAKLVVPMSQHLGAPCQPLVAEGEPVLRGQVIGDVDAMVSAPVHAPASGYVTGVVKTLTPAGVPVTAVEIEVTRPQDLEDYVELPLTESVKDMARSAGLVGLGGAAFPTHVKLNPPPGMPIDTVIVNGCECEPFLTCDERLMIERASGVIEGAKLLKEAVGARRAVIGVEDNKPEAIAALRAAATNSVEVLALPTRYPQGAEKMLIRSVLGAEVEHGKLPASTGALVSNVGTALALVDAVEGRKPLIERVVTVTGAVKKPGNYLVPVGTLISDLIEAAGGLEEGVDRVIAGGPMTGFALGSLDVPVVKGTSGIVALKKGEVGPSVVGDQACVRCSRCMLACPMSLQPWALASAAERRDWDAAEELYALDCIECGSCTYVCPTRRPLVQLIRRSKQVLMERGAK